MNIQDLENLIKGRRSVRQWKKQEQRRKYGLIAWAHSTPTAKTRAAGACPEAAPA